MKIIVVAELCLIIGLDRIPSVETHVNKDFYAIINELGNGLDDEPHDRSKKYQLVDMSPSGDDRDTSKEEAAYEDSSNECNSTQSSETIESSTEEPKPEKEEQPAEDSNLSEADIKAKELRNLVQHLYIAQARVQLEATEIRKAQAIANAAQQTLEEAANNVRTITSALQNAQQEVAAAAIRAQTAQLQLAAHDQLLFAARQDVDALSSQMVGLQAAEGISAPRITVDLTALLDRLKQPLPDNEKPTPIPTVCNLPLSGKPKERYMTSQQQILHQLQMQQMQQQQQLQQQMLQQQRLPQQHHLAVPHQNNITPMTAFSGVDIDVCS